jgi:DNA-binding transcriptional regulator YiaG
MTAPQSTSNRETLNSLLWQLNLLNTEVADLCGVSERTVYRWLSGTTKVPNAILKLLQITLNLRKQQGQA